MIPIRVVRCPRLSCVCVCANSYTNMLLHHQPAHAYTIKLPCMCSNCIQFAHTYCIRINVNTIFHVCLLNSISAYLCFSKLKPILQSTNSGRPTTPGSLQLQVALAISTTAGCSIVIEHPEFNGYCDCCFLVE